MSSPSIIDPALFCRHQSVLYSITGHLRAVMDDRVEFSTRVMCPSCGLAADVVTDYSTALPRVAISSSKNKMMSLHTYHNGNFYEVVN